MKNLSFRELLIEKLQKRMDGASRTLRVVYRPDLVTIYLECEREIQIQQSYLQMEGN